MDMAMNTEGSIRFWLQQEQPDWTIDENVYQFRSIRQSGIAIKATKHPDKTIELNVTGPLGQSLRFRQPIPPCDKRGLHVVLTWKQSEIKLYLNANPVETLSVLSGYGTSPKTQMVRTVGKCIYCGQLTERLSNEHIVPYGLNGPWILEKASCPDHATKTSKFELDVLRYHLIAARTTLGFRTYNRKKRPTNFTVDVEKQGQHTAKEIPVGVYPAIIIMPIFPKPAHLEAQPYSGNRIIKYHWVQVGGKKGDELLAELGADHLTVEVSLKPFSFAQMLAKIAYCITVAQFGYEAIEEAYVLPAIRGETDEIGRWVGTSDHELLSPEKELHTLVADVSASTREVLCRVRLFSVFNAPEYLITVGKLNQKALGGG